MQRPSLYREVKAGAAKPKRPGSDRPLLTGDVWPVLPVQRGRMGQAFRYSSLFSCRNLMAASNCSLVISPLAYRSRRTRTGSYSLM